MKEFHCTIHCIFIYFQSGNVDTQQPEDYFTWLGEELIKNFDVFVGPRKRQYISTDVSEDEDDQTLDSTTANFIVGTKADHSMCRVFMLGFLLQFLLQSTPSKPQKPKTTGAIMTTPMNEEDTSTPHERDNYTVDVLQTPKTDDSISSQFINANERVPPTKTTPSSTNFFRLQEAARMELTRTLDFLTKGITVCDISLISLANKDNFMHLVAQQRGVHVLQSASNFNIPLRHTFLDYVRYETSTDIRVPGRYHWDNKVTYGEERPLPSFARLVFEPKNDRGTPERVVSWESKVTLIQDLLKDVSGHAKRLHDLLSESRGVHDLLFFMQLANIAHTEEPIDNGKTYEIYYAMYEKYKSALCDHELLFREYDNTQDDKDFSELSASKYTEFATTDSKTYKIQCEKKIKELIDLPYSYNILQTFLFQAKNKFQDTDIQSFTGKLSELGDHMSTFKTYLVRE